MPDKDFEQQIREGLGDWEMVPPPSVRQAVLDSVRQRRRRRAFLWIPTALLLLGLLAGGAWYALRVGPEGQRGGSAGAAARVAPAGAAPTGVAGAAAAVASSAGAAGTAAGVTPAGATAGAAPTGAAGVSGLTPAGTGAARAAAPVASPAGVAPTGATAGVAPTRAAGASGLTPAGVTPAGATAGVAAAGAGAATQVPPPAKPADVASAGNDGAARASEISASLGIVALPGDLWRSAATAFPRRATLLRPEVSSGAVGAPAVKKAKPLNSKWSFRISASAGVSGQGSLLDFAAPSRTIYTRFYSFPAANNLNAAAPPGAGTAATSGYDTLAAKKAGPGWTLGIAMERRLSPHFRVGAGLDYARLDTRIGPVTRGTTATGALTSVYNTASSINYSTAKGFTNTNGYSLLRVPLDVTWMVAPSRRWNPSVYGGVAGAFLFSGDALMYEPDASGYTKNHILYRHWSLYGEAGFTMDLLHAGWFVLQAGPVVQYGFSGLEKPAPVKDHLNYAGIRLNMLLPTTTNKHKP